MDLKQPMGWPSLCCLAGLAFALHRFSFMCSLCHTLFGLALGFCLGLGFRGLCLWRCSLRRRLSSWSQDSPWPDQTICWSKEGMKWNIWCVWCRLLLFFKAFMTFVNVNSRNQSPPLLDFDLLHQSSRGPGPMKGLYYSICICTSNPKMPILSDHYLKLVEVHTQLPPFGSGHGGLRFSLGVYGGPNQNGTFKNSMFVLQSFLLSGFGFEECFTPSK